MVAVATPEPGRRGSLCACGLPGDFGRSGAFRLLTSKRGPPSRELAERQRAEKTLATSLQTLENVFRHLVPEQLGQSRAITISTDGQNAGAPTGIEPVVSPEAAALLDDLRKVYDQLASTESANVSLSMDAARATRRLGDIYGRLGDFDRSEKAYRQALEKYEALHNQDTTGHVRLELARLHNDLGGIYGRKPDPQKSQNEHRQALAILGRKVIAPGGARYPIRVGEDVLSVRTRSGPVGEPRTSRRSQSAAASSETSRSSTAAECRFAAIRWWPSRRPRVAWAGTPRRVPAIPKT